MSYRLVLISKTTMSSRLGLNERGPISMLLSSRRLLLLLLLLWLIGSLLSSGFISTIFIGLLRLAAITRPIKTSSSLTTAASSRGSISTASITILRSSTTTTALSAATIRFSLSFRRLDNQRLPLLLLLLLLLRLLRLLVVLFALGIELTRLGCGHCWRRWSHSRSRCRRGR